MFKSAARRAGIINTSTIDESHYILSVENFRFSLPVHIRFSDLDAFGIVNNAVYFTYMEEARTEYLIRLNLIESFAVDPGFIIAEATCQFKIPIRFEQSIVVKARVEHIGTSSFRMVYQLEDQATSQIAATGRTINVAYDYSTLRSRPLPDHWRAAIEKFEAGQ